MPLGSPPDPQGRCLSLSHAEASGQGRGRPSGESPRSPHLPAPPQSGLIRRRGREHSLVISSPPLFANAASQHLHLPRPYPRLSGWLCLGSAPGPGAWPRGGPRSVSVSAWPQEKKERGGIARLMLISPKCGGQEIFPGPRRSLERSFFLYIHFPFIRHWAGFDRSLEVSLVARTLEDRPEDFSRSPGARPK